MNKGVGGMRSSNQAGAALMVVLVLLLVMTVLGLSTLRGAVMEERMSANLYDRSLGFQSAEVALREAEDKIKASAPGGAGAAVDCSYGSENSTTSACLPTPPTAFNGNDSLWANASSTQGANVSAGVPSAGVPQYFVQYMGQRNTNQELGIGEDPNYGTGSGITTGEFYRVAARSNDPSTTDGKSRSVVVLQSTIVRQ